MNHSSALEYSSQLPVSVYGTGSLYRFSWKKIRYIISQTEVLLYYCRSFNALFRQCAVTTLLRRFYL